MINTFKASFRCHESFKNQFSHSQCLLSISVGQPAHENEKLDATITAINSSFKSCVLLLGDSLQRHTLAIDKAQDADFFYDFCIQEGKKWLERNKGIYSKLKNLVGIVRWDNWLNHINFLDKKNTILSLIQENFFYRTAFENTIDQFIKKLQQRTTEPEKIDLQKARHHCMDYLVEESAALCLWTELGCEFDIYPAIRNQAMSETHKLLVLPNHTSLLHPVAIKFKKRKQSIPLPV